MKLFILLPSACCLFLGCAYVNSNTGITTTTTEFNTNGTRTVTVQKSATHARATTFFDAQSSLAKFRNSTGGPTNAYTQGTAVTGFDQSSSASNVVAIINAAAGAAAAIPK